jgi:hypothetical protein
LIDHTPNIVFPSEENYKGTRVTPEKQAKDKAELMETIETATVIIRISYTVSDFGVIARITQIISINDNIDFTLKVGDEYTEASRTEKPDGRIGEGAIVFLKGSNPTFNKSLNIHSGSIPGYENMKLEDFINFIKIKRQDMSNQ